MIDNLYIYNINFIYLCVWFSLSASPSVPLDITVTHISDTSFSLTWLPPANTRRSDMEIDYYKITIKSENHTEFNCFSYQCNITEHSTMITNLKHGVKYNISISAINCVGLGESSDTLHLVTGTQNSLPMLNISSTISVNVIVATCIHIILVVLLSVNDIQRLIA